MRAGQAKHRLTFQQDTGTTRDATGGLVSSWVTFVVLWMQVQGIEARENDVLRRRYADATYSLTGRWNVKGSRITPKMRVIDGPVLSTGEPGTDAKLLDILGVIDPDGSRKHLQIAAKERDIG